MTEISHIVALSPEGQVVIPKDIRDALGLEEGAKLEVALEGHRVVMRTVSEKYPDWRSLEGAFGPVDQTTSEILAEGRRECPDWRTLRGAYGHVDQSTSEILAEGRREEFEKERRLLEHLRD